MASATTDQQYTTGRVTWAFASPIAPPTAQHTLHCSVESVAIPRSWHVINPYNNGFTINGTAITITPGNYSAYQLAVALGLAAQTAGFTSFTVSYNATSNKFKFVNGATAFTLGYGAFARRWLGFARSTTSASSAAVVGVQTLESTMVIDLSYTKTLRIMSSAQSMVSAPQGSESLESRRL